MRPGHAYPCLFLWGFSDVLLNLRVNCLPQREHLKTYFTTNFRVSLTVGRRVVGLVRDPKGAKSIHRGLVGGAEIDPAGVRSIKYLGINDILVASAPWMRSTR